MTRVSDRVRIEKAKWDGTLSSVEFAQLVAHDRPGPMWLAVKGTERRDPGSGDVERLEQDELWLTIPGEPAVLCAYAGEDGSIDSYTLHAAVPPPEAAGEVIRWIDLDLDLELSGGCIRVADEAEFHRHAHEMGYPRDVIVGAWRGIAAVAPLYTTGEWPFDDDLNECLARARSAG
jgi:hypothetical protein